MTFENLDNYLRSKICVSCHHQKDWHWLRYLLFDQPFAILNISYDLRPLLTIRFPKGVYKKYRDNYPNVIVEAIDFPGSSFNTIYLDKINGAISDNMIKRLIDDSYNEIYISLPPKFRALIEDKREQVLYCNNKNYNLDVVNKDLSAIIKDIWENYDNNPETVNAFRQKYQRTRMLSKDDKMFLDSLKRRKNSQIKRIEEPTEKGESEFVK